MRAPQLVSAPIAGHSLNGGEGSWVEMLVDCAELAILLAERVPEDVAGTAEAVTLSVSSAGGGGSESGPD
jgi:hypothetical protein